MIRLLTDADRERVMDLLTPESTLNLFIIGDIESNGLRTEFQELWGDFDAADRLQAVLLRYYGSFIPYAPGEFDVDGLAGVLLGQKERMTAFSGLDRIIRPFEGHPRLLLDQVPKRTLFFVELRDLERLGEPPAGEKTPEKAGPDDVPVLMELWREVEGFRLSPDTEDRNRRELATGAARAYLFRDRGKVIATAKTTAETSNAAMVVAVATHRDYRRRGLATQLLVRLCRELLAEGKRPCLFYDNPAAGGIYRRLGFTDLGLWVMYLLDE